MVWVRRNKVALTIVIGLVLIGLFAVAASGVAAFAISRFRASFDEIAETNLPALIAASKLSELSQTFVATAPEIVLAESQLTRQALADQLSDRLASLGRAVDRVDRFAVDHGQVAEMRRQLDDLVANLNGLDGLVRDRIEANNDFETIIVRLPPLATRVRAVADEIMMPSGIREPRPDPATPTLDQIHLVEWSAAGLESITPHAGHVDCALPITARSRQS